MIPSRTHFFTVLGLTPSADAASPVRQVALGLGGLHAQSVDHLLEALGQVGLTLGEAALDVVELALELRGRGWQRSW